MLSKLSAMSSWTIPEFKSMSFQKLSLHVFGFREVLCIRWTSCLSFFCEAPGGVGGMEQRQTMVPMRSAPRLRLKPSPANLTCSALMLAPWRWVCVQMSFLWPSLLLLQFHVWSGSLVRKAPLRGGFVLTFTAGLLCNKSLPHFIRYLFPNSRNTLRCVLLCLVFFLLRHSLVCLS